jgi:hypothetical protein
LSDADLVHSLEELEHLLLGNALEAETIAVWRKQFDAALASVDRGPGWPQIVTRAHELATKLDARTKVLSAKRDQMGKELGLQAQGARALKGYKPA